MDRRRPLCATISDDNAEPLFATASRIDHWLVVEYRGQWGRKPLSASTLTESVKRHVREQLTAVPRSRLLFVRRAARRLHPGLAVYAGTTRERDRRFFKWEIETHDALGELDLARALAGDVGDGAATPVDHPLLVVCTHGKRDRCCAKFGRPLYDALREEADEDWVWQSTHVGGDRFAANLVCFPHGLYFGRLDRLEIGPLLDEYLAGRIYLAAFRGSCCYPFPVQAAERAVRAGAGLTGTDDIAVESVRRTGPERWDVAFRAAASAELHEVSVTAEHGDPTYLTCSAETLRRPRRYVATGRRVRASA